MKTSLGLSVFAAALFVSAGVSAQVISVDLTQFSDGTLAFGTTPTTMSPTGDVAGAPGSRVGYWNMVTSGSYLSTGTLLDSTGATVSGLDFGLANGAGLSTRNHNSSSTNDYTMLNTTMDVNWTSGTTISLTNVPYASYDVRFYMFPDTGASTARGGHVTIGSTTYYINGGNTTAGNAVSLPDGTTGSGYILSTATTLAASKAAPGNYVEFDGLTGSTLNASLTADNFGDNTPRMKLSGFQVIAVAVPEPSSLAVAGLGLLGLVGVKFRRTRRANLR